MGSRSTFTIEMLFERYRYLENFIYRYDNIGRCLKYCNVFTDNYCIYVDLFGYKDSSDQLFIRIICKDADIFFKWPATKDVYDDIRESIIIHHNAYQQLDDFVHIIMDGYRGMVKYKYNLK